MAVILDADYKDLNPSGSSEIKQGVLYIRLPCKELENLLLLSPATICNAARREAERRRHHGDEKAAVPNEQRVLEQITTISRADDLRNTVKPQWMCRWAEVNSRDLNEPGQLKDAEAKFQQSWEDDNWRIRCCPGKHVLKRLRKWLQDEFSISLSIPLLFDCYEPSDEIRKLIDALESHIT